MAFDGALFYSARRRSWIFGMVCNPGGDLMKAGIAIALATAAILCASGAAAQFANQPADGKKLSETLKNTLPASIAPAPVGAGGMMIFIDPATGKFRQPDAADIAELLSHSPPPKAAFVAQPRVNPNGGIAIMLDSSFENYMVVTKKPDGSLLMDCLPDAKKAADAVANGLKSGEILRKKEVLDVQ